MVQQQKSNQTRKGLYHRLMCHKQVYIYTTVPHNHPHISSCNWLQFGTSSYLCRDVYVGRWLFVAHEAVVYSYLYNSFLVCLLFLPLPSLHPSDFLGNLFFALLVILQQVLFVVYIVKQKRFPRKLEGCRDGSGKKVCKQGKDCTAASCATNKYHRPTYTSLHKQLEAPNCKQLQLYTYICGDGYVGRWYILVCGT